MPAGRDGPIPEQLTRRQVGRPLIGRMTAPPTRDAARSLAATSELSTARAEGRRILHR